MTAAIYAPRQLLARSTIVSSHFKGADIRMYSDDVTIFRVL